MKSFICLFLIKLCVNCVDNVLRSLLKLDEDDFGWLNSLWSMFEEGKYNVFLMFCSFGFKFCSRYALLSFESLENNVF